MTHDVNTAHGDRTELDGPSRCMNIDSLAGQELKATVWNASEVRVCTVLSFIVIQIASLKTNTTFVFRFSICYKKNEKRLQTNYHRFPNISEKTKNCTTNRYSFRCIGTKNEMRLQRNLFFLFRFRNRAMLWRPSHT